MEGKQLDKVKITYIGHSCFCLEYEGQRVVLDPYSDGSVPGLSNVRLEAEYVYCSHHHGDHGFEDGVELHSVGLPAFTVEELETDHDNEGGTKRGKNTVHIFRFGAIRVAHLGDLGRLPTEEEAERLAGLDCLMIPVGGFFTIDAATAKQIVDMLEPQVVIPMHYRSEAGGFDVIAPLEDFTGLFLEVNRTGSSFELTEDAPRQVLVMEQKNRH